MAKILVVDDETALRELMSEFLKNAGHSVESADSGMAGLAKLRAGGYQLVTLDIDMPGLNGTETLKLIRREPALAALPVLMCTARGSLNSLDAAFEDGATGYIVKPFDLGALLKSVNKALAGGA